MQDDIFLKNDRACTFIRDSGIVLNAVISKELSKLPSQNTETFCKCKKRHSHLAIESNT